MGGAQQCPVIAMTCHYQRQYTGYLDWHTHARAASCRRWSTFLPVLLAGPLAAQVAVLSHSTPVAPTGHTSLRQLPPQVTLYASIPQRSPAAMSNPSAAAPSSSSSCGRLVVTGLALALLLGSFSGVPSPAPSGDGWAGQQMQLRAVEQHLVCCKPWAVEIRKSTAAACCSTFSSCYQQYYVSVDGKMSYDDGAASAAAAAACCCSGNCGAFGATAAESVSNVMQYRTENGLAMFACPVRGVLRKHPGCCTTVFWLRCCYAHSSQTSDAQVRHYMGVPCEPAVASSTCSLTCHLLHPPAAQTE